MKLWKSARRGYYPTARALRAFVAHDGSDWDWTGALMVAEFFDQVRFIKSVAEAYAKAHRKK